MARLGSGDPAFLATPTHHDGSGRQSAVEDLVPPHQPPAVFGEKGVDLSGEPCLKLGLVLQAKVADLLLDLGAGFPLRLVRLVAADVDLTAGKQRHHFRQHVFAELDRLRPGREDVVTDSPVSPWFEVLLLLGKDAQVWIGRDRRTGVAGHFDLGHDGHVAVGRVLHDLSYVFLTVESSVAFSIKAPRLLAVVADQRLVTPGTDFRQPRVLLDLDAPALIVGEMHLQAVELVQSHDVDELQQVLFGQKVPSRIDQQPTPGETRTVGDPDTRHRPTHMRRRLLCKHRRRQQLPQRLNAVEQPGRLGGAKVDPLGGHVERIALAA